MQTIKQGRTSLTRTAKLIISLMCLLSLMGLATAQTPQANAQIGNQASATYTDASNISRTATSNTVNTTVSQVAALDLTAPGAKNANQGAQVVYPHTLSNTGNGADTFNLSAAASAGFTHTGIAIYADANGDGIADNAINLTSAAIPYGGTFTFVVVATVPASAATNSTGTITVTATSQLPGPATADSNADVTTVTGNAVINANKTLSQSSGVTGTANVLVTLTYTNNGNATANNITFTDVLPAGMTYVAGSGRWSVSGATALTDATGGDPAGIAYDFTGSTVTATVGSVAPSVSGTISFRVNITAPAPGPVTNTATYAYNDGASNVTGQSTNSATFTVLQTAGVTVDDGAGGNTVTVASAAQGATVSFTDRVRNDGNGSDTFNITYTSGSFPSGTTFQLFKSDGVSPLLDTNSDGIPDTGPLAAAASYNVVVKATLPSNATSGGSHVLTGTSVFNSSVSDTVTNTLTAVTVNTVDTTFNSPTAVGVPGAGVTPTSQTTNNVNPGATTMFTLFINNTSTQSDAYDLTMSGLGAGWTGSFSLSSGACTTANLTTQITNTGAIAGAGNLRVCAVITVPAGFAPGSVPLTFTATSPTSGATDPIIGTVAVQTVNSVTLATNNTGQVFPGGSVTYTHTLTNNGNATESGITLASINNQAGWNSAMFFDTDSSGTLNGGDLGVSGTSSLTPGQSITIFVKVNAPASAGIGAINVTTTTATYNVTSTTSNTDTTTVIAGQLRLSKAQAADADCDEVADTAYSTADITGALPGSCVMYQITAENQGTADVTSVVISDATPAFTTYTGTATVTMPGPSTFTAATLPLPATLSEPGVGSAGTVSLNLGATAVQPLQTVILFFSVQINP